VSLPIQNLFKKMAAENSGDSRMSVDSGPFVFHYLIQGGVCYLTLTDKSYPRKLAFQYLEELQGEFSRLYGPQIEAAARPYAFIKFGRPAVMMRMSQVLNAYAAIQSASCLPGTCKVPCRVKCVKAAILPSLSAREGGGPQHGCWLGKCLAEILCTAHRGRNAALVATCHTVVWKFC
jgi:hypothetical protein